MSILRDVAGVVLDFLDRHDGAITAIATVVIAWFTVALAKSTRRLWRESEKAGEIANKTATAAKSNADAYMLS